MINEYPVNYEKTLEAAKKQTAVNKAVECIDDIEEKWARITACEGYSLGDLKKDILLVDIRILLKCCIVFINEIAELRELVKHHKPSKLLRAAKRISLPLEE